MLKVALNLEKSEPAHPRRVVGAQMTECATAESEAWCHLTCMTCVTHPEVRVIMGGSREHPRPAVRKLASSSESPQTGTWACYLLFSEPDLQAHPLGSQLSPGSLLRTTSQQSLHARKELSVFPLLVSLS